MKTIVDAHALHSPTQHCKQQRLPPLSALTRMKSLGTLAAAILLKVSQKKWVVSLFESDSQPPLRLSSGWKQAIRTREWQLVSVRDGEVPCAISLAFQLPAVRLPHVYSRSLARSKEVSQNTSCCFDLSRVLRRRARGSSWLTSCPRPCTPS